MAMASLVKVILGSIAFGIFWVMAVFPSVPVLPIGRTAGSMVGGVLMVVFRVISPAEAYHSIDLPILGLLFGTMVVSVYLERADMFKYLGHVLSWRSRGAKDLLLRVCLVSAVSGALFTNDTACVVLTEFVLKLARHHNLPPHPFLLALATSANIGSAATPIGNPQNLVIAVQSGISFGSFLAGLLPATLVGLAVNAAMLLVAYWRALAPLTAEAVSASAAAEAAANSHRFSPATLSHFSSLNSQDWSSKIDALSLQSPTAVSVAVGSDRIRSRMSSTGGDHEIQRVLSEALEGKDHLTVDVGAGVGIGAATSFHGGNSNRIASVNGLSESGSVKSRPAVAAPPFRSAIPEKWRRSIWKLCVYLVTAGMLAGLLLGLDMSWTAITAALALIVLDFKDAQHCLEKVSYSLLIFFCGMFITVDGFNKTGIPSTMWDMIEPHAKIDRLAGIAILALVIVALSNLASNVPTVLLLGGRVAASAAMISGAQEKKAWLILAWASTVAGNLSLLGSAANLIVCEQARRAPQLGYNLSFWTHLKFGIPSTLIVTAVGLTLIR